MWSQKSTPPPNRLDHSAGQGHGGVFDLWLHILWLEDICTRRKRQKQFVTTYEYDQNYFWIWLYLLMNTTKNTYEYNRNYSWIQPWIRPITADSYSIRSIAAPYSKGSTAASYSNEYKITNAEYERGLRTRNTNKSYLKDPVFSVFRWLEAWRFGSYFHESFSR